MRRNFSPSSTCQAPCTGRPSSLYGSCNWRLKTEIGEDPQVLERSVLMKTTFVDLKNPDLYREGIPHEVFARLRREAPVAWNPEKDGQGFWAVTRYEDIVAVSKNPKVFSSARKHGGHRMFDENVVGVAGVGADKTEAPMISMDPPEHNLFRRMVSPGFAPRRVLALEDRIRE